MTANKFLIFKSGEKSFCLATEDIKLISKVKKITPINHPNVIGVTIIHEEIYSCINSNDSPKFIIALNIEDVNVGILCSKIEGFSKEIKHYLINAHELALNNFRFKILSPHKCFHFLNKEKACNLIQLYEVLSHFNEISHHINNNDFAKWINDVLKQPKIAKLIEKTNTQEEIIKSLKTILEL
jgi:hypothetical protein